MRRYEAFGLVLLVGISAYAYWRSGSAEPEVSTVETSDSELSEDEIRSGIEHRLSLAGTALDEVARVQVSPDELSDGVPADDGWGSLPTKRLRPSGLMTALGDSPDIMFRWKGVNPEGTQIPKAVRDEFLALHEDLKAKLKGLANLEAEVAVEEVQLLRRMRGGEFTVDPNRPHTMVFNAAANTGESDWRTFVFGSGVRYKVATRDLPNTTSVRQMSVFAEQQAHIRKLDFFTQLGILPAENRQLIEEYFLSEGAYDRLHALRLEDGGRYRSLIMQLF